MVTIIYTTDSVQKFKSEILIISKILGPLESLSAIKTEDSICGTKILASKNYLGKLKKEMNSIFFYCI